MILTGMTAQTVTVYLPELEPGTTYHYRITATNAAGTARGDDAVFQTDSAPDSAVLIEDFEHGGAIPDGWTQQYVTSNVDWAFADGNDLLLYSPSAARSGLFNAYMFDTDGATTRLISPALDLAKFSTPTLFFWQHMTSWSGDQDTLVVLYRTAATEQWQQIASYDTNVTEWTQRSLTLPATGPACQVAFEGTGNYGYGVCIDDVTIVPPAMTIVHGPQGGWFEEGQPLELTVQVVHAAGATTYQWEKDGQPIAGATDAALDLGLLDMDDSGWYLCNITDEAKSTVSTPRVPVEVFEPGMLPSSGWAGAAILVSALILAGFAKARPARRRS